jgi:hypothetical protein
MNIRFRVNGGAWFTPKVEFASEWAGWLYIKDLYGDIEIESFRMEVVHPALLMEQAS